MSGTCFFTAPIRLNQITFSSTNTPISDLPTRFSFFTLNAKYLDEQPGGMHFKPRYTWHWPDRCQDRFMFAFVVNLSEFLLLVGIYILFHYYQDLAPDRKKNTCTMRKLPRSWPDPFSGSRTRPDPNLSKIRPCDTNFFWVARSGQGSLMVWCIPLLFTLSTHFWKSDL